MRNYRVIVASNRRFTYLASVAGVVALLLSGALTGTGASPAVQGGPAAQARHLAYDPETGTMVAVYKPAGYATPVPVASTPARCPRAAQRPREARLL
jgi:hypothetical protein